jgi:hypothetical protein
VFFCPRSRSRYADLPLIHPTAGCIDSPDQPTRRAELLRVGQPRPVAELFAGTAQLFQNELAAFSYNFVTFLAITSCDLRSKDLDGQNHEPRARSPPIPSASCPTAPYQPGRCSLSTPQLCANVKSFLAAVGVTRNTLRAAGNERFGRRTFIWHSGGEVVLRYDQHNVLGFATDFAEDHTQTSWGLEFTWVRVFRTRTPTCRAASATATSSTSRCRSTARRSCAVRTRSRRCCSTRSGSSATCPTTATASP